MIASRATFLRTRAISLEATPLPRALTWELSEPAIASATLPLTGLMTARPFSRANSTLVPSSIPSASRMGLGIVT